MYKNGHTKYTDISVSGIKRFFCFVSSKSKIALPVYNLANVSALQGMC